MGTHCNTGARHAATQYGGAGSEREAAGRPRSCGRCRIAGIRPPPGTRAASRRVAVLDCRLWTNGPTGSAEGEG
jgi:hypothetical protein